MKGLVVAFSMYSKIPMPKFAWDSKDMKYHLCFFPLVGLVIGALEFGWFILCRNYIDNVLLQTCMAIVIPLLVTGGFHVDGFLDCMDAFHSYQPREKKLEILKDPHIGAFAVICFAIYLLLALGAASCLCFLPEKTMAVLCFAFVLSRIGSGLGVTYLLPAKKDGMLHTESTNNGKKVVGISLWVQLGLCIGLMLALDYVVALVELSLMLLFFLYYKRKTYREFGGITGDTAGYYVTMTELVLLLGAAVVTFIPIK